MKATVESKEDIEELVREFVLDDHPCVMAQSVIADDNVTIQSYGSMDNFCPNTLMKDLEMYVDDVEQDSMKFQTFIAVFDDSHFET